MTHVCIMFLVGLVGFGGSAFAAEDVAQSFTLDGRLYADSAASTPLADIVSLKIQILNQAQDCILYEETQSVNTTSSSGYYTIQVGQKMGPPAGKRSSGDSNNTLARVFSNAAVAFNGKQLSDGSTVCAYTPSAGHARYMKITMTPSDGISRSTTTNMLIDSVPMAIVAERAESLQGYTPAQFIQVNNTTSALTQGNLESIFTTTGVSRISDLISVPSTSYVKTPTNGGAELPSVAGNPSSPAVGQIWYDSVANQVKYYDGAVKTLGTVNSGFVNGGNSFGAAATLGTNDNFNLNFEINGSSLMTLDTNGRVGIGTTNPAYSLDLGGNAIRLQDGNANKGATITEMASTSRMSILQNNNGSTASIVLDRGAGNHIEFNFDGSEKMRINSFGNVGIGTTTPETKMHLATSDANTSFANNVLQSNLILQNLNTTVNNWTQLGFHSANGSIAGGIGVQNTNHTNHRGDMAFFTRGPATSVLTEKMRITGDGNVGIGTNNPGASLEVATGNIRVTTGGIEVPQAAEMPIISNNSTYASQVLAGNIPGGDTVVIGKLGATNKRLLVGTYDWSNSGAYKGMRIGPIDYQTSFGLFYNNWHNSNPSSGVVFNDASMNLHVGGAQIFYSNISENRFLASPALFNGSMVNSTLVLRSTYDSDTTAGTTSSDYDMKVVNTMTAGGASPASRLDFKNNSDTNLMSISSSGNVGIGTTSSTYLLNIEKSVANQFRVAYNSAKEVTLNSDASGDTTIRGNNNGESNKIFFRNQSAGNAYIRFTSRATDVMTLEDSGQVGIGTLSPNYQLEVVGAGGSTVAHFSDGTQTCSITPNAAGSITCSSDERLKRDIASVEDLYSLEKILQLRTVTYKWKKGDDKDHTGYIAQEIEQIAPEMVHTSKDGYKQVSYVGFIPWITGAIKEIYRQFSEEMAQLKSENSEMKARTEKLEKENEDLKRRLDALERKINSQ